MASAKSIRKYGKKSLIPYMKEQGFELVKGFSFVKQAPQDMIYFIDCFSSRWGNVHFNVGVYVQELEQLGSHPDLVWPHAMRSLVGGELNRDGPMLQYADEIWKFDDEPEKEIDNVETAIKKYAIPFFDSIRSREEMIAAIDEDWYKWQRDDDLIERIKNGP